MDRGTTETRHVNQGKVSRRERFDTEFYTIITRLENQGVVVTTRPTENDNREELDKTGKNK